MHCLFGPVMIQAIKRSGGDGVMARRHEGSAASHIYDFLASLFSLLFVLLLDARLISSDRSDMFTEGSHAGGAVYEDFTIREYYFISIISISIIKYGHTLEGASPRPILAT